jgi:hypothetical protein
MWLLFRSVGLLHGLRQISNPPRTDSIVERLLITVSQTLLAIR